MRTFFVVLIAALAVTSCNPKPGQGPGLGSPGIISCGERGIVAAAPTALGPVNACLSGDEDITACLLGLITPATKFTLGLVGCLTKHEGAASSAAAQANTDDKLDAYRAARARDFLQKLAERGWTFTD